MNEGQAVWRGWFCTSIHGTVVNDDPASVGVRMRSAVIVSIATSILGILVGCSEQAASTPDGRSDSPDATAATQSTDGPTDAPAEVPSGTVGELTFVYTWKSVVEAPREYANRTVTDRQTTLVCPVEAASVNNISLIDGAISGAGMSMADSARIQSWYNEGCRGSMTVADSRWVDDPTIAGPEPTVHTTGTQPIDTRETLVTVETDLNKNSTRYMLVMTDAAGFQQEAGFGFEAKLVNASIMPEAVVYAGPYSGPIQNGSHRYKIAGGEVVIDWTFRRL